MFVATGTTISWESGFLAEILDIKGPEASRESIQTSHFGTATNHTFTPADLVDWGEITIEIAFQPGETPPISSAVSSMAITWADSTSSVWTFSAFMVGFAAGAPFEGRATATCQLKISGGVTIT